MYLLLISTLAGAASAAGLMSGQRASFGAMSGLFERQLQVCQPVPAPATCEKSCGPGNIQCISFPNCYNPSAGETCCSNGKYCPAGSYCTDAGCCPNGTPLAECGATVTLSVIPPPVAETTTAPPVETASSQTRTIDSAAITTTEATTESTTVATTVTETTTATETATETPTATATETQTTAAVIATVGSSSSAVRATTTVVSGPSPTQSTITLQTLNAAPKQRGSLAGVALGGLGLLFAL